MGRIIRKKTTSKKKTKNLSTDPTSSPVSSIDVSKNRVAKSAGPSGDAMIKKIIPIMKKSPSGTKVVAGKQKKSIVDKSMQFLREVKIELKKVTWPSRKQTIGSTAVVIILVIIISLFLGMVDFGLSSLIRVILQ
jgi:preprotein translocase subunit SecE